MSNIIKFPNRYTMGDVVNVFDAHGFYLCTATVLKQRGLIVEVITDTEDLLWLKATLVERCLDKAA